ncbi:Receptor-type tyrosine-protein phosphatase S [Nymphon striatum]|nr:Receptor-type tyrosine-protein phosphatase S [Nymphon striatum]
MSGQQQAMMLLFQFTAFYVFLNYLLIAVCAKLDTHFTLRSTWGRLHLSSTGAETVIRCTSNDSDPSEMRFGRVMDAGNGIDLPPFYREFGSQQPPYGRALHMGSINGSIRFGAYFCEEKQSDELVRITTLKLPPFRIAEIDPVQAYKVVNIGESVILAMQKLVEKNKAVLWLKNGTNSIPEWKNKLEIAITNVTKDDQGIYECFYAGERSQSLHGIMRLIVRGCPASLYGSTCNGTCPSCFNGGICHDVTGDCICPPGFTGLNCERACGGNKFGADCEQICYKQPAQFGSNAQNFEMGCQFFLFCKLDPYGCSCAPGFQGSMCDTATVLKLLIPYWKNNVTTTEITSTIAAENSGFFMIMCNGSNIHGTAQAEINITVVDPPMLLTRPLLANKTADSFFLQWFSWEYSKDFGGIPGDNPLCKPVYKVKNASLWVVSAPYAKNNSTVISNLDSNIEYKVAVICKRDGENGVGSPGPETIFRTSCGDATPESGLTLQVINITTSSISLKWNEPNLKYLKCDVIGYVIILAYHLVSDRNSSKYVEIGSKSTSFEITSLLPFTKYTVEVRTKTSKGVNPYPGIMTSFTSEAVPGKIDNIKKEYTSTYDKVILSWSEPLLKNGIINYYQIKYMLLNRGMCGEIINKVEQEKISILNSVMLENLKPFSNYQVYIGGTTKVGVGIMEEYFFMTLQSGSTSRVFIIIPIKIPISAPENLRVTKVLATSVEISWDVVPCLERNGRIVSYEYEISHIFPLAQSKSSLFNTTGNHVHVDDLLPNTNHKFRVRLYTDAGVGPFSSSITQRTVVLAPDIPELSLNQLGNNFIVLDWTEPSAYAPVALYELQYRSATEPLNSSNITIIIEVSDSSDPILKQKFIGLSPSTDYLFQIRAENSAGRSKWSPEFKFRTPEELGKPPINLILSDHRYDMLQISWQPPVSNLSTGFTVTGFLVKFQPIVEDTDETYPEGELVLAAGNPNATLVNLMPDTKYTFIVSTITNRGIGGSVTAVFKTDVEIIRIAPIPIVLTEEANNNKVPITFKISNDSDVPRIFEIIIGKGNNVEIHENDLFDYYNASLRKIPYYIAANISSYEFGDQVFVIGDGLIYDGYENVKLAHGHFYNVWIRAVYQLENRVYTVLSPPGKQIYRKYEQKKRRKYYSVSHNVSTSDSWHVAYKEPNDKIELHKLKGRTSYNKSSKEKLKFKKNSKTSGIPVEIFPDYVKEKSESASDNFQQEFKVLRSDQLYSWHCAIKPDNVSKNRYGNVLPYDHSRVILKSKGQRADEDYINANYIDVSPKPNTASDFWRMVWQEKSLAIVMLTELNENNKPKCCQYWPNESKYYEDIQVMQIHKEEHAEFRIHTFLLRKPKISNRSKFLDSGTSNIKLHTNTNKIRLEKGVRQGDSISPKLFTAFLENVFRCLNWTSKGIPINGDRLTNLRFADDVVLRMKLEELPCTNLWDGWTKVFQMMLPMLLKMQRLIRAELPAVHGPIIVHCSAGVGRAGVFVAIDALLKQASQEKKIDVFNYVRKIRNQRMNLVQTDEQYMFIHEALLEAILTGDTEVQLEQLPIYFKSLNDVSETGETKLQQQYSFPDLIPSICSPVVLEKRILPLFQSSLDSYFYLCYVNSIFIPTSCFGMIVRLADRQFQTGNRVSFLPYIDDDASLDLPDTLFVSNHENRKAYLVTSMPSSDTAVEFWSMVYRHKSNIIIMLNELKSDNSDQASNAYWPNDGCKRYGFLEVQIVTFEAMKNIHFRTMKIINTNSTDRSPHVVIHLQYFDWPEDILVPRTTKSIVTLLDLTSKWVQRTNKNSPVTIHCRDGVSQSGLICAVTNIKQEMDVNGSVDVFRICKRICSAHIDFLSTMEQYKFCYELALYIYNTSSLYA